MKLLALAIAAVASLDAARAFSTIAYDQVRPFPEPYPSTFEEKLAVKHKPLLKIAEGCFPYPAVQANGSVSNGLSWTGDEDEYCEGSEWGSQVYSRGKWYDDYYAIMYAWYFPKAKGRPLGYFATTGHRHQWEFAVVWLNFSQTNESKVFGVSTSNGDEMHHEAPLKPKHILYSSIKLEAYSKRLPVKHALRLTKIAGTSQSLIQWDQLSRKARQSLNGFDFDTDNVKVPIEMPLNDFNFRKMIADSAFGVHA